MYTIISATTRPLSNSSVISRFINNLMIENNQVCNYIDLGNIDINKYSQDFYNIETRDSFWKKMQDELLIPTNKFIFVIPEYNGCIPGMLKSFIDVLSIYERDATFKGKKALLIGIAAGRAGNLRGIESFTSVLNYLGTTVFPLKQPIGSIHTFIKGGKLVDVGIQSLLTDLVIDFRAY